MGHKHSKKEDLSDVEVSPLASSFPDTELSQLFNKTEKTQEKVKPLISQSKLNEFIEAIKPDQTCFLNIASKSTDIPTKTPKSNNSSAINSDRYTKNTIFIANVPISCTKKNRVKDEFVSQLAEWMETTSQSIASVRFRCLPVLSSTDGNKPFLPKRVALSKNIMDPTRDSVIAYIRFTSDINLKEAVAQLNGKVFQNKHLRADIASEHGSSGSVLLTYLILEIR